MRRALLTALLLVCLALPAAAHAHGDPVSDALHFQDAYLPLTPKVPKPVGDALNATLKRAKAAGFPLKVAVVGGVADMGQLQQLIGRPAQYTKFLAAEVGQGRPKPLLVVLPSGYATAGVSPEAKAAVEGLDPPPTESGDKLGRATIDATLAVAKAEGHPLPKPKIESSGGTSPAIIFGVPVLLLALGGGLAALRSRQSTNREQPEPA